MQGPPVSETNGLVTETTKTTVDTTTGVPIKPVTSVSGAPKRTIVTRLVWLLASILVVLLAFRFVLAALGANPANPFAGFIYRVTYPFVAPFLGLFGYHLTYGVSQIEVFTLVAMAVYLIVAGGLTRIINITSA